MSDLETCPRCGVRFALRDGDGAASITYDHAEWSTCCRHPTADGLTACLVLLSPLPVLIPPASLAVRKGDHTSHRR